MTLRVDACRIVQVGIFKLGPVGLPDATFQVRKELDWIELANTKVLNRIDTSISLVGITMSFS